jgi:hypothetical protein
VRRPTAAPRRKKIAKAAIIRRPPAQFPQSVAAWRLRDALLPTGEFGTFLLPGDQ